MEGQARGGSWTGSRRRARVTISAEVARSLALILITTLALIFAPLLIFADTCWSLSPTCWQLFGNFFVISILPEHLESLVVIVVIVLLLAILRPQRNARAAFERQLFR